MKRFFTIVCTIEFLLSMSSFNSFASQSLDEQLIANGFPEALVQEMLEEQKESLVEQECVYVSTKVSDYDEEGNLISVKTFENDITPYGQIKSSSLTLTIIAALNYENNIVITANYKWKVLPVNRWQDPIGIRWDDNVFKYKSGSFKKVDKCTAKINGKDTTLTFSNENRYADMGYGYVTWYADLAGHGVSPTSLFGYGEFHLVRKEPNKKIPTQVFMHYVHAKLSTGLSLSYSGAGFSVSGGSSYDEAGTDLSFSSSGGRL